MKRTVGKIYINGEYRIVYDTVAKENPYTILFIWYDAGRHQKTVNKYADLKSALFDLYASI